MYFWSDDRARGRAIAVVAGLLPALALLLPMALVAAPAEAVEKPSPYLIENGAARPTKAWLRFCAKTPGGCRVDQTEEAVIPWSAELWNDLVMINTSVNRSIRAVTDADHWGVSDRWDYPTDGIGDCEDIQIEKRRRLAALGYPARAMRMAVVVNPEGEGHAVLVVRTGRGDLVLDNRVNAILPWHAAQYTWVKREADDGGPAWVALGGLPAPAIETAGKR